MKKTVTIIMILSIVLSLLAFQPINALEVETEYQTEIEFLKALDLIDSDYDASLVITKSEMVMMILNAYHYGVDFSTNVNEQVFKDVSYEHPYYGYIKACKDLGIAKGDDNGNFHPNSQVTLGEAVTMIINALGYAYHAEAAGGYPYGYYEIAMRIGTLKGINNSVTDIIDSGIAIKLIYNSLFSNIVEMGAIEEGTVNIEINPNVTVLNDRFKIYEHIGVISDDGVVSIEDASISDDERAVVKNMETGNKIVAYKNGVNVSTYFGQRVKAYIKTNEQMGRYEFKHIIPVNNTKNVIVSAKDIFNVASGYVEYDEDPLTSETEKISLPIEKPTVIFNGIKIIDRAIETIIPSDGYVSFIDYTGDGSYDLVNIISFNYANGNYNANTRNIVVDTVSTVEDKEEITCLFNPSLSIELNEDNYIYSFVLNDKYTSLSDLKSGMIVSVAEAPVKINNKTYYMLAVSDNTVSGTLESTSDTNEIYLDNDAKYNLSTSLTGVKSSFINTLKYGAKIDAYLDITGKIAYAKSEVSSTKDYAYIVKAVKKSVGDEYVLVKFFSKDGKMSELPLSDKATIDGVSVKDKTIDERIQITYKRADGFTKNAGAKETGRPAIVKVSKDMIISIDTDTPNPTITSGSYSDTYLQQSYIKYYEEDAESYDTLKAGFRSPRAATFRGNSKSVGGKFFITSDTTILHVPEIDTYGFSQLKNYSPYGYDTGYSSGRLSSNDMISLYEMDNEDENYYSLSLSQLFVAFSLDLQGYDIDPDTGVAGLLVIRGRKDAYRSGSVAHSNPMSIFLKTSDVYDEELEKNVKKVYYLENGETKSATIDLDSCYFAYKALIEGCSASDTPYNVAVPALKNGDVIRAVQSNGKLTHIERVLITSKERIDNAAGLGNFASYTSKGSTLTDLTAKTFTHTYNDITFMLTENAKVESLFTVTDSTHTANAYVNMIDCKFDFETNAPAQKLKLFNADGKKISVNYTIAGSEIHAKSMENIVFSNILEGSSLIADKGTDNEYMKVYVIEANKDTFTKTTMNTIDGEKKFNEAGKLGGYALFILGYEEEFNPSGALSYFNKVFAAVDTFILSDGSSYTGPVGVVFATTLDKVGDYDRTEYGVILSEEELTVDEFKTDKKAVWAKGLKINSKNQYGIRFYGNKIKAGKTYYTLPYAKYENTKGDKVIVYGTKVMEFTPSDN